MSDESSPQDEEVIINMILRDIKKELIQRRYHEWAISRVRLQKTVFLIAERLNIPITRSWYLYGGYVHSRQLEIEDIRDIDEGTCASVDLFGMPVARPSSEPCFYIMAVPSPKPYQIGPSAYQEMRPRDLGISESRYFAVLKEALDETFKFRRMSEFLRWFYQMAPEPYRDLYFHNAALNEFFKNAAMGVASRCRRLDEYGYGYEYSGVPTPSTDLFKKTSHELTEMLVNLTKTEFSDVYEHFSKFAEIVGRYTVKVGYDSKHLSMLKAIHDFYRERVWKAAALKISVSTVKGMRAEDVRAIQRSKLSSLLQKLPSDLAMLEEELFEAGALPSAEEMRAFYERVYGRGGELARALIGALRGNG